MPPGGPEGGRQQAALAGIRKAAIFLVSVKKDLATQILAHLDEDGVRQVTMEIARLEGVTAKDRNAVLQEFFQLKVAREYVEQGGIDYAKELLEKSLPKDQAAEILGAVQQAIQTTPFSFLNKAETENLLTFIQDEHPQTIALILAHLPPSRAAEVLKGFPPKKQLEVVKRVATMEQTNPDILHEVERSLERRISAFVTQEFFEEVGGVQRVAEILNLADRATEKAVLESLEEESPDLVETIRRLMFVFEDILKVDDRGIQKVLKEVDQQELALALKTASTELRDKIFRNMSARASELIKEEMDFMGPVRVSDVESSQQRIVDIVRRLEDAGEIIISGRGGESEVVV